MGNTTGSYNWAIDKVKLLVRLHAIQAGFLVTVEHITALIKNLNISFHVSPKEIKARGELGPLAVDQITFFGEHLNSCHTGLVTHGLGEEKIMKPFDQSQLKYLAIQTSANDQAWNLPSCGAAINILRWPMAGSGSFPHVERP